MAPRTAKAKKPSQSKVAENEAPQKGRGKTKTIEEPEIDEAENEVGEAPVIEKRTKRGRKAEGDINGMEEETNGDSEVLPTKKVRKHKVTDKTSKQKEALNGDNATEIRNTNPAENEEIESNGHSEEVPASASGKGRKKPTKKEFTATKANTDSKTSSRGKKQEKQETESDVTEKDEEREEKLKPASKGRTRKAPQKVDKEAELEEKNESGEEEGKADPPTAKGRKRGPAKSVKGKTPVSEQDEEADKSAEEPKKKETKSKKIQAKKASAKNAEIEEEEEEKQEPATKKRKVAKKDEKVLDEVKDEEGPIEEIVAEPKPSKGKRGQKKVAEEKTEEAQDTGDATIKRRRKAGDEKEASSEELIKKKAPPKNKATTDFDGIDFSNTSKSVQGKEWNLKIASWNVDGIRAWLSKGGLDYLKHEKPDILCLQETKCAKDKLPEEIANLPGYHAYWQSSDKDGYAGVGIYTTKLAMNVQYGLQNEELDSEGRIITAEYEQFYLICTYVPNAGRKLVTLPKRLQWNEEFRNYVKALDEKKPVIICGDMNVAHNEIDLSNPKSNKKNAGFTQEERAGMTELLSDGFVDIYRHLKPDETGVYTFWTYMSNSRAKNVGWRLDYFLMSERLLPSLCDSVIRSEVYGSDHCPITLFLHITSADKPKE